MTSLRPHYPEKWDKYIGNNKLWKQLELRIELVKNKPTAELYNNKGQSIGIIKKTDKILLRDNKAIEINGLPKRMPPLLFAKIKVGTTNGLININRLRKPTNRKSGMAAEKEALNALTKDLESFVTTNGCIDIKIKGMSGAGINTIYKCCHKARDISEKVSIPGFAPREAKADFAIVDVHGNDVIFISHKKAGGAKAFQQYGGTTRVSGTGSKNPIEMHEEVQNFYAEIIRLWDDAGTTSLPNPMYREISSKDLIMLSVFGPDYNVSGGKQKFGIDNCQIIGQGNHKLTPTKTDNLYELDYTSHLVYSGDPNNNFSGSGEYKAVLGVRAESSKGFNYNKKRYKGARTGIFPKSYLVKRGGIKNI